MSARLAVAGLLEAKLQREASEDRPGFRVLSAPRGLDRIEADEVVAMVQRDRAVPGASRGLRDNTLSVWLLCPQLDQGKADDVLDPALDDVLDALSGETLCSWSEAERGVYQDQWHGYRIVLSVITTSS